MSSTAQHLKPEEKFPALAPVYARLGDRPSADVLDCIVFAYPEPATKARIADHLFGEGGRGDMKRIPVLLRDVAEALQPHGFDLFIKGGNAHTPAKVYLKGMSA